MPRVERIREVLAGPLSPSYVEKKTGEGWKPVVVVWEREVEGAGPEPANIAEGILPAVVSGRLAAEAILAGDTRSYPGRLAAHPVLADYRRVFRLREAASALARRPSSSSGGARPGSRLARRAVARGFAWMFSGARLPAPRLVDAGLALAERWADNHRPRPAAS